MYSLHPRCVIQVNVERVMKALKECGEKGKQLILAAVPLIAQEPDWTDTIRDLQVSATSWPYVCSLVPDLPHLEFLITSSLPTKSLFSDQNWTL